MDFIHRGMTNESEEPRMMPALIYTINWLRKSKLEVTIRP